MTRGVARAVLRRVLPRPADLVGQLVEERVRAEARLRPLYESLTDEEAYRHFGDDEPLEHEYMRRVVRLFHAWRVETLRDRLGERLEAVSVLDVGDTDGRILKALGKSGIGCNLSPAAVRNIESNGVQAVLGDGHRLPFDDASFDVVLCFQTLEHAESPAQLLAELRRVCRDDGRVFITIPSVPRTVVHSRDPSAHRGSGHVFEFSRKDFLALLTHTDLECVFDAVCDVLGSPRTLAQRALLLAAGRQHVIASTFRRFHLYELTPKATDAAS